MYSHHSKNGTTKVSIPKYEPAKLLLEIGEWKLVRSRYLSINSYPLHDKCGAGVYREIPGMRKDGIRDGTCTRCGEMAPDEILALWKLHNWDTVTGQG